MKDSLVALSDGAAMQRFGWREWVSLPDLGIQWVKAKVDTGARTSVLHAVDIQKFERDDDTWVRFTAIPWQRCEDGVPAECPLLDERIVRSSNGVKELRPVITTTLVAAGSQHLIEINLTNRSSMNFRMLLGREALRRRFLVDPTVSHCSGLPPAEVLARGGRPRKTH